MVYRIPGDLEIEVFYLSRIEPEIGESVITAASITFRIMAMLSQHRTFGPLMVRVLRLSLRAGIHILGAKVIQWEDLGS